MNIVYRDFNLHMDKDISLVFVDVSFRKLYENPYIGLAIWLSGAYPYVFSIS